MNHNIAFLCLGIPMLMYLGQAAYYAIQMGKYGLMLTFIAYAVANVGFVLDLLGY